MSVSPNVTLEDVFSFFVKHVRSSPKEKDENRKKKRKKKRKKLIGETGLTRLQIRIVS